MFHGRAVHVPGVPAVPATVVVAATAAAAGAAAGPADPGAAGADARADDAGAQLQPERGGRVHGLRHVLQPIHPRWAILRVVLA